MIQKRVFFLSMIKNLKIGVSLCHFAPDKTSKSFKRMSFHVPLTFLRCPNWGGQIQRVGFYTIIGGPTFIYETTF